MQVYIRDHNEAGTTLVLVLMIYTYSPAGTVLPCLTPITVVLHRIQCWKILKGSCFQLHPHRFLPGPFRLGVP